VSLDDRSAVKQWDINAFYAISLDNQKRIVVRMRKTAQDSARQWVVVVVGVHKNKRDVMKYVGGRDILK
jgi:hypothetical protein